MHKIHITEGLVLGKRGVGEGSTFVALLTKDIGLVHARAQSARAEKSKLRYGLEPLTLARFSLVRGKQLWRLVGVEAVSREFVAAAEARRKAFGRMSKLLLRLLTGEEPQSTLFVSVKEGFLSLTNATSESDAEALECVLVLRILAHLGYLPERPELRRFTANNLFSLEIAAEAARSRALLIKAINESLSATGL